MSIMALVTMGISVEQRLEKKNIASVELVGIPSHFIPFHIRALENHVMWLDEELSWRKVPIFNLLDLTNKNLEYLNADSKKFIRLLQNKSDENKILSFNKRQNSLILWVEPKGIDTAWIIRHIISVQSLPLRVGLLPILANEEIYNEIANIR